MVVFKCGMICPTPLKIIYIVILYMKNIFETLEDNYILFEKVIIIYK